MDTLQVVCGLEHMGVPTNLQWSRGRNEPLGAIKGNFEGVIVDDIQLAGFPLGEREPVHTGWERLKG